MKHVSWFGKNNVSHRFRCQRANNFLICEIVLSCKSIGTSFFAWCCDSDIVSLSGLWLFPICIVNDRLTAKSPSTMTMNNVKYHQWQKYSRSQESGDWEKRSVLEHLILWLLIIHWPRTTCQVANFTLFPPSNTPYTRIFIRGILDYFHPAVFCLFTLDGLSCNKVTSRRIGPQSNSALNKRMRLK